MKEEEEESGLLQSDSDQNDLTDSESGDDDEAEKTSDEEKEDEAIDDNREEEASGDEEGENGSGDDDEVEASCDDKEEKTSSDMEEKVSDDERGYASGDDEEETLSSDEEKMSGDDDKQKATGDGDGGNVSDDNKEEQASRDEDNDDEKALSFEEEASDDDQEKEASQYYLNESLAGLGEYLHQHFVTTEGSGFSLLQACLRDCMLAHRWQEASQVLEIMCLYPAHQSDDYLWKCGMEVLYNHPNSDPETIEHFSRKLDGIYVHRRRKRLERAFYLLSRGQRKDAEVAMQFARILHDNLVRKVDLQMDKNDKMMCTAYFVMLKYMERQQESLASQTIDFAANDQEGRDDQGVQEGLGSVIGQPGVWDIFITKQVELLETDGRYEDARELLEKYCSVNQDNPNAHRYLYRFLKRNGGNQADMIRVLQEYVQRIPSDVLALDLVSLLQKTARPTEPTYIKDICLITNTLFDMLDYNCWYKRLAPWKALSKFLTRCDCAAVSAARPCWSERGWWSSYHFDKKAIKRLIKKRPKVALHKAVVAILMNTKDLSASIHLVRTHFTKKRDKKSLRHLDSATILVRNFKRRLPNAL